MSLRGVADGEPRLRRAGIESIERAGSSARAGLRGPVPRNPTKAALRFETRGGAPVVVKDYRSRPAWLRLVLGRRALRREARAYARLAGVEGVPRCLGIEERDRLVVERVPGRPVREVKDAGAAVFDEAADVLARIHARGVAVADLHRRNLLVSKGGAVHVVDFALARIARDAARPGPLVRALQRLDGHAHARVRARALGEPEPVLGGWLGAAYRAGRGLKTRLRRWRPPRGARV